MRKVSVEFGPSVMMAAVSAPQAPESVVLRRGTQEIKGLAMNASYRISLIGSEGSSRR